MTYESYRCYKAKPEHGGYSETQIRDQWQKMLNTTKPYDKNGVMLGQGGFDRFLVTLTEFGSYCLLGRGGCAAQAEDGAQQEAGGHLAGGCAGLHARESRVRCRL